MFRQCGLLLCAALISCAGAARAEETVSIASMKTWQIVCPAASTEAERYAATEFQSLFKGLTGTELPLVESAAQGAGAIFIGPEAIAASGAASRSAALGEEDLVITVDKNALRIDGGRPRGTLYGVYEFFEALCGVRYLTFDHTWYPENADALQVPLGEHAKSPLFAFRWSYYGETMRQPEFGARLHTNTVSDDPKLGGKTGYRLVSHNVAYLVPPATHGAEHPEYYALVDGQRKLEMKGGGPQLCATNPAVIDLVTQAVLDEIVKNPDAKNINIAQMDNSSYCTCENCAAVDAREESHAGATLALVNTVAERIEKTHPEVLISTYAYQYTRKPPKTLRARHNVLIQLCSIECCDFHAIDDPACALNRTFCEDTAGWKQKADTIFIWHYNTNFRGYVLPFPNFRAIGKSVEYFANNNGRGVFMQAAGNGFSTELSDLRNYVMSRCLWEPGRDSWKEAEEFCRLHYAEAAQPILDYLAWYHDLVGAAGVHPTCFPTESALAINAESASRMLAFFDEALALATSEEVRARVEKASLCALRAGISAACMHLTYNNGVYRIDTIDAGLIDRFDALRAKYQVSMEGETTPMDEAIGHWRKLQDGLPAVKAENEFWRVVVLPEASGKIVEMTYKPTGRNVVQPARALSRFRYEDWVRQGEGPSPESIVPFTATPLGDKIVLSHDNADGSRIERVVALSGDAIRFETTMTAGAARPFDMQAHPEYDAATLSSDPAVLQVFVKAPDWVQANAHAVGGTITEEEEQLIKKAVSGGAFAYYNQDAKFGVEHRFDPADFGSLLLYWEPSRIQLNLEMFSQIRALEPGEQARYAYEVRYLSEPPVAR